MCRSIILAMTIFSLARAFPGSDSISWGDCPPLLSQHGKIAQCGNISVPLDWDYPEKGNVTLGMAKYPAQKPEERKGTIFWQPGGPGEPATQHIALIETGSFYLSPQVLDHFDIIGVDVRGSGLSSPINCDADIYNARFPWPIDTQEKWESVVETNIAFRESCLRMTGNDLIDYMDSVDIARDYEAIRIALGGEPMNWLGMSYGTTLGLLYAEHFPYNIRSMVLDGPIPGQTSKLSDFTQAAAGSDAAFRVALRWCRDSNDTACPAVPEGQTKSAEELWNDIIAQAEREPIKCSDANYCTHGDMTALEIRNAAIQWLYVTSTWGVVTAAIYNTTETNDTAAFTSKLPFAANTDGGDPLQAYTNSYKFANRAVVCQDQEHNYAGYLETQRLDIMVRELSPLLRGVSPIFDFQLNCLGWPEPVRNRPHKVSIARTEKLPMILMVQGIYDNATPLSFGLQLREDIGNDRVVTVFRDGGGHGSFVQTNASSSETVATVEKYLLDLSLPEDGTIYES